MSRRERQRRRNRSKGGIGRVLLMALGLFAVAGAIGASVAVGYVISIADGAPSLDTLKAKDPGQNSTIYAADGSKLGIITSHVLRTPIAGDQIPQSIKDATVAIEDKRFYQHKGVDFEGIVRAAVKNLKSGSAVQGGSTLTMQLIKNIYSRDATRDFKRKLREAKLAEELEDRHPGPAGKQWILNKYLNNVPYGTAGGQEALGVQAAARVFFNKPAKELTLAESALLAGLPQAPTDYNPYIHKAQAIQRRNEVLASMRGSGYITAAQETQAASQALGVEPTQYYKTRRENYFFDYVRNELIKQYGRRTVLRGGLKVHTTIDLKFQQLARDAIKKNLGAPGSPSSALVSMDPKTGYVKAMASSSNYGDSKYNLATQGRRQPGSTFKIIVLMTAIRRGVDINKVGYTSKRLDFVDQATGTPIDVDNSDGATSGRFKNLFQAVVTSDNTVFQQLDLDLGPKNVTKTARDMGITSPLDSIPAEALGGLRIGVSPLEMTRAYASVNNGGWRVKPITVTRVEFPEGKVDRTMGKVTRFKVFTDGETFQAIQAMKGNVKSGTGTAAGLSFCPAAGKTGTTSGFKDAWFNGMTRNLNTAVWVGYPNGTTVMDAVPGWGTMFGGKAPASIWHDFMSSAVTKSQCGEWPQPKTPFVAKPFSGTYYRGGGGATGSYGASVDTSTQSYQSPVPTNPAPPAAGDIAPDATQDAPDPAATATPGVDVNPAPSGGANTGGTAAAP